MSLAWATVVVVILLLPGFAFIFGFYAPNQVTREISPTTPLMQLAIVVLIAFITHSIAYVGINSDLCRDEKAIVPCVDFNKLATLLRADVSNPISKVESEQQPIDQELNPDLYESKAGVNAMLNEFGLFIALYFVLTTIISAWIGFRFGSAIANGHLKSFTRHRYLFPLEACLKGGKKGTPVLKAYVLSKTMHNKNTILYEGYLQAFFSKADGTISYLVLFDVKNSIMSIHDTGQKFSTFRTIDGFTNDNDSSIAQLVITSENIANVYFTSRTNISSSTEESEKILIEKIEKKKQIKVQKY